MKTKEIKLSNLPSYVYETGLHKFRVEIVCKEDVPAERNVKWNHTAGKLGSPSINGESLVGKPLKITLPSGAPPGSTIWYALDDNDYIQYDDGNKPIPGLSCIVSAITRCADYEDSEPATGQYTTTDYFEFKPSSGDVSVTPSPYWKGDDTNGTYSRYYSLDGGYTWTEWTGTPATLTGPSVRLRGVGCNRCCENATLPSVPAAWAVTGTDVVLGGDFRALLDYVKVADGSASKFDLGDHAFHNMFKGCSAIRGNDPTSVGKLKLDLSNVTSKLPANACESMFDSCIGITALELTLPETLGDSCCKKMFQTSGLTSLSMLPITIGSSSSGGNQFTSMFQDCAILSGTVSLDIDAAVGLHSHSGIFSYMFSGCTRITSLSFKSTMESGSSGDYMNMFYGCTMMRSVTFATGTILQEISSGMFSHTGIMSITIPSGTTSIGLDAFNTCTSLSSVTMPTSLTSIGESAFQTCTSLRSLTFPQTSAITIGNYAFRYCSSLKSVDFLAMGTAFKTCTFGSDVWSGCALRNVKVTKGNFDDLLTDYHERRESNFTRVFSFWVRCPGYVWWSGTLENDGNAKRKVTFRQGSYYTSGKVRIDGIAWDGDLRGKGYTYHIEDIEFYGHHNDNRLYNKGESGTEGKGAKGSYGTGVGRGCLSFCTFEGENQNQYWNNDVYVYGLGALTDADFTSRVINNDYAFTGLNDEPKTTPSYIHSNEYDPEDYKNKWTNWKGTDGQTNWGYMNDFCYPQYVDQWIPVTSD